MNKFFLLLLSLVFAATSNAQLSGIKDKLIGNDATEPTEETASVTPIDSTFIKDSIRIAELTQQVQQMHLNEILLTEELDKHRFSGMSDSLKQENRKRRIDSLRNISIGQPLVVENDTLLKLYASKGGNSPANRVKNAQDVIYTLGKNRSVKPDSIYLLPTDEYTEIMYKDKVIMSVLEDDALWMNISVDSLAKVYRSEIVKGVKEVQAKNSIMNIIKQIGKFLLVIIVVVAIFYLLSFLNKKLKAYIIKKSKTKFKPVTFRNYELLNTSKEASILVVVANIVRYLLMLITLIVTIPIIFSIFPQTKSIAETLFNYILTPIKSIFWAIVKYIPNLFMIIIIWLCMHYVIKALKYLSKEIQSGRLKIPGFYVDWAEPTFNLARFFLYAFMVAMIYPYLPGASSGVFQGISVFIGLIVSLGSTAVIGNIVAGMVITYMRPYKVGDKIKINETVGNVIEKTAFVTRIRTPKNEIITIPNSFMMSSQTINYTTSATNYGLILHTTIGVGYNVPFQQVHELLIKAAKMTDGILPDKEPFVLETQFNDSYNNYQINAYITDVDSMSGILSDLHSNIQAVFQEAKIDLQTPLLISQNNDSSSKPTSTTTANPQNNN